MSKRMKFSVIGLPHYTIWHLYEPSVDDLRHMEEMEQEKKARDAEEKAKADRAKQIKEEFRDTRAEWEKDGAAIQDMIQQDVNAQRRKAQNEKKENAKKENAKKENAKKENVKAGDRSQDKGKPQQ